jgi:hypothetical protein
VTEVSWKRGAARMLYRIETDGGNLMKDADEVELREGKVISGNWTGTEMTSI